MDIRVELVSTIWQLSTLIRYTNTSCFYFNNLKLYKKSIIYGKCLWLSQNAYSSAYSDLFLTKCIWIIVGYSFSRKRSYMPLYVFKRVAFFRDNMSIFETISSFYAYPTRYGKLMKISKHKITKCKFLPMYKHNSVVLYNGLSIFPPCLPCFFYFMYLDLFLCLFNLNFLL